MPNNPAQAAVTPRIPLCEPYLNGNEWEYVKECLDTNWVSSGGSYVNRFERSLADYVGADHAVATNSGTAALHISLMVAGVQAGDEVLVSSMTFIAPANAVRYLGAYPVFIDAEADYWQMDPLLIKGFLEQECQVQDGLVLNKKTGRPVTAIIPVHILGHPCDMDPILELAEKYDLRVIEDATESLGARYKGRMLGTLGDVGCFSFNGNKLITTGGGGMIVTNNQSLAKRAEYLTNQAKDDPLEYVHHEIGFNYRLTNLQAAVGFAQMERIENHIEAKLKIAARYGEGLSGISGLHPMQEAPWADSVQWLYTALVTKRCTP